MRRHRCCTIGGPVAAALLLAATAVDTAAQPRDKAFQREFMLNAEIVNAEPIGKGVTQPWRLTLSDGTVTHDVAFQSVNERRDQARLGGRVELGFTDAYRYNIAAYRVSELLGLDHMMPMTVERRWRTTLGAMTWWVDDVMMDEEARLAERRWADDVETFNRQYARMQVFAELVYDTDRNHGNILYDTDWNLWMIDFSRAFRIWGDLRAPNGLNRCDADLLKSLGDLTRDQVEQQVGPYLNGGEVGALMERRDKLVQHFETLIAERGELAVVRD